VDSQAGDGPAAGQDDGGGDVDDTDIDDICCELRPVSGRFQPETI